MNLYQTRYSLLTRTIEGKSQDDWNVFENSYRNFIIFLLSKLNIPKTELEDITQDVLLTVWKKLKTYDKTQSKFRTWLASVVRYTALNAKRRKQTQQKHLCNYYEINTQFIENIPDETEYNELADREWKNSITKKAVENIRGNFRGQAMEVFDLLQQGKETKDIAKTLNISESSVYSLKSRVLKRLIQEVYLLQNLMEPNFNS